ncbi:hypothetical protein DUNSADRAFT_6640 [Dunaliella salina]|uniref:Encoded protein n=1 Tax=Dunaliella salina TaxID=3046 RepID=A0ABQ7FTQ0_DUNSA|nr:hypothetical protein DUNSADRAFT_6640 [Dunaliella salina]|eukprot:KAF5825826.1 hypothetical protein DUNSADRAFT_6640 [Dunaliella salina]
MLAVCSWSSPPLAIPPDLPSDAYLPWQQQQQQQLGQGPPSSSNSSADSASVDDEQFAFDAVLGPGSGEGLGDHRPKAPTTGAHKDDSAGPLPPRDALSTADGVGVWGAGSTHEGTHQHPDPSDLVEDVGQKKRSPVPSLQMLAQSAVARTLVEPRTVLQSHGCYWSRTRCSK